MGFGTALLLLVAFMALLHLAAFVCAYCIAFDHVLLPTALGAIALAYGAFLGFLWRDR